MSAIATIERVLATNLLSPSLCFVPSGGADELQLANLEGLLPRRLSASHRAILLRWNGIDVDVVRLMGTSATEGHIQRIEDMRHLADDIGMAAVAIGSDPSGFVYFELSDGTVVCWDHDGGKTEEVASTIDEFIDEIVFGSRAREFLGEGWAQELRLAGLV